MPGPAIRRTVALAFCLPLACAEQARDHGDSADGGDGGNGLSTAGGDTRGEVGSGSSSAGDGSSGDSSSVGAGDEVGTTQGDEDDAGDDGVRFDVQSPDLPDLPPPSTCPDEDPTPGDDCDCGALNFQVDTKQSCALAVAQGTALDAEGFIEVGGVDWRVFAMDRWGLGRVIAWCDGTTLEDLLAAFNVRGYLGGVADARVASVGDPVFCDPNHGEFPNLPQWLDYQGIELPAMYKGKPELLAQDWDAVVVCPRNSIRTMARGEPDPNNWAWAPELEAFVTEHGKGVLAAGEYGAGYSHYPNIIAGSGITFQEITLEWAPATSDVDIACVPGLPPVG